MDVLDHSCSKLGFGGKMCIDGTVKMEEEMDDKYTYNISIPLLTKDFFKPQFEEIVDVNVGLLTQQIPCVFIAVKKNRKEHIKEIHNMICALKELEGIKMLLYVDDTVDVQDISTTLWRFCNNLDPKRDHILSQRASISKTNKV